MTGHVAAPEDGIAPYDTCAGCRQPIRQRAGLWVTMVGANGECYQPAAEQLDDAAVVAREGAKAERAPELDADDSSLGSGRLAEAFPDADLEPVTASDAAAGRPEMGEDYHTQPVGSGRHRTAHWEYLEATGGPRDGWTAEQEYAADHWAELEYDRQQAELEAKYAAEEPPEGYEPDVREVDEAELVWHQARSCATCPPPAGELAAAREAAVGSRRLAVMADAELRRRGAIPRAHMARVIRDLDVPGYTEPEADREAGG